MRFWMLAFIKGSMPRRNVRLFISTSGVGMVWHFLILCRCNMRIHKWSQKANVGQVCLALQKSPWCNIYVAVAKHYWMHLQHISWLINIRLATKENTNLLKRSDPRRRSTWICAGLVAWKPLEGGFPSGGTLRNGACLLWRCSPYIDQRCLRHGSHPEMRILEWNFRWHTRTI